MWMEKMILLNPHKKKKKKITSVQPDEADEMVHEEADVTVQRGH